MTLDSAVTTSAVILTEIRRILKAVFEYLWMFPDSKIALQMRLQHAKACHITNFWIAPHFVSVLNHESSKSAIYFLSFNESLNNTTLECEMNGLPYSLLGWDWQWCESESFFDIQQQKT